MGMKQIFVFLAWEIGKLSCCVSHGCKYDPNRRWNLLGIELGVEPQIPFEVNSNIACKQYSG